MENSNEKLVEYKTEGQYDTTLTTSGKQIIQTTIGDDYPRLTDSYLSDGIQFRMSKEISQSKEKNEESLLKNVGINIREPKKVELLSMEDRIRINNEIYGEQRKKEIEEEMQTEGIKRHR